MLEEKEEMIMNESGNLMDIAKMYEDIYRKCEGEVVLTLDTNAYGKYKAYHNEVVNFRQGDLFEGEKVSL